MACKTCSKKIYVYLNNSDCDSDNRDKADAELELSEIMVIFLKLFAFFEVFERLVVDLVTILKISFNGEFWQLTRKFS